MNRAEIIAAYNLPRFTQSEAFINAYRALRALVDNKDRAYERMTSGKQTINRRSIAQSTEPGTEGST